MTQTETQSDALRLAALLQCGADDPMWDQHCGMRKDTVSNAAAELRRLHARVRALEFAFGEWSDKTDWVQETAETNELGMHRADVLRARIEALHAENEVLKVQLASSNERAQMLCRQKELWRERAAAQAQELSVDQKGCAA